MTKYLPFYLDNKGFYTNQKCYIITGEHLDFLVTFLNSKIFKFCFRDSFPTLQGGTRELSKLFFEKIPVLKIDDKTNELFASKVKILQNLAQKNIQDKKLEDELENILFKLYKLNDMEKDIIKSFSI